MDVSRRIARALMRTLLPRRWKVALRRSARQRRWIAPLPVQYPFWQMMREEPSARPPYKWGLLCAASLARNLGVETISAIEFGVAGGNGLLALGRLAAEVQRLTGVAIDVYGFDTGTGLTKPEDHRDLPQLWSEGFYAMDEPALRARLESARLVLGPVEDTEPGFVESRPAPIGFVAFDLDMYHPTMAAFDIFRRTPELVLPRVTCYFDDLIGFSHGDFSGERLAISNFNEEGPARKISKIYGLRYVLTIDQWWVEQMYMLHAFDHPRYCDPDGSNRLDALPLH